MARIVIIAAFLGLGAAGYYLGSRGVWAQSLDLDRSVRVESPGGAIGPTRVK